MYIVNIILFLWKVKWEKLINLYCSVNRWEESGNLNDRPRGRPPRCTTPAQDQQITAAAADSPFTNAVAIRDALHLEVSATTARRRSPSLAGHSPPCCCQERTSH